MKISNEAIIRIPKRKACPSCGSTNLLMQGPDQFCCSCDWDTCLEYVERGLMNNIEMAFNEHFRALKKKTVTPSKSDSHQDAIQIAKVGA